MLIIPKISVSCNYSVTFGLSPLQFLAMTDQSSIPPADFESAMAELEHIVANMESDQLTLEQSLTAYRRGAELLQFCQRTLNNTQQQVEILENNVLQPFVPASNIHEP